MTRTEFFALLVTVCLMAAINVGMVLKLGLSPWLLLIPFAVVGLTFPHPKTRALRDGLFLLLVAVAVLRSFAGKAVEREIRWSLGVASTSAVTLGFVVYTHGDGLGAGMRRLVRMRGGRSLYNVGHYILWGSALTLLIGVLIYAHVRSTLPLWFVATLVGVVLPELLPARWGRVRKVSHTALGFVLLIALGYGLTGRGWGVFAGLSWICMIPSVLEKLRMGPGVGGIKAVEAT